MLTVWLAVVVVWLTSMLVYSAYKNTMSYWKDRGVPHLRNPLPILGNYLPVITLKNNLLGMYSKAYNEFPEERMVGIYEFTTTTLVIRDPDLIEEVLVKKFSVFPDHGPFVFEPASGIHLGLFNLYGDRWRALRNKLLSTFATERMRCVFPSMVECCEELVARCPDRMDRYSFSDFAGGSFLRSLFGIKLTPNGKKEFRANVKTMFESPINRYLQQAFLTYFPKLADFLNARYLPESLDNYFMSIVNTILDNRENLGNERKDFTDILINLRKSKKMNIYDRANSKIDKTFDVDNHLTLCQGFFFMFAGLETTSLVMLYTAFHLASNPKAQQKAREEVRKVREKHGSFTYDAIREMKYIEQCIQESLRIHPSLVFLMRVSDRDTEVGGVPLKKGTRIIIPNFCLQHDPKYFPNPEQYDPDRFDASISRSKFIHLPFSDGPRVCLGKRFSLIEMANLFAHLLDNFELYIDSETPLPLEFEPKALFLTTKKPIVIKLSRFNTDV